MVDTMNDNTSGGPARQPHLAENKMGVMPINRLLITMSVPMIMSMLVQALYNVVDSLFVSRIGEEALTAVSLAFPIQLAMMAIAGGTGVGVNAVLSRSLGEKNHIEADKTAHNGIFLAFLSFLIFFVFGVFFIRSYFAVQTSTSLIVNYGYDYLSVICTFSCGLFGQVIFDRLLQSTGRTFYTMITQGVGAIINIILDPIMIFGLFGFPALGVRGAALATIIGQMVAAALSCYFNIRLNRDIHLMIRGFRPNLTSIRRIYTVGFPSIIMIIIGSIMTFGLNTILLSLSATAAAVFGVYFRLQSFIFMPVFGLNNGLVPIVAYNYGARRHDRIKQAVLLSILYAVGIMTLGFVVFQLFPRDLLALFNASETMMEIGVKALRTISWSFLGAGFCIVTGSVLQALFNSTLSMFVSIARQLVVLLPAAWFLSHFWGLDMVWWAFPIAELVSIMMSAVFLRHSIRQIEERDRSSV
jgi:putative MATE family efflux protein